MKYKWEELQNLRIFVSISGKNCMSLGKSQRPLDIDGRPLLDKRKGRGSVVYV